MNTSFDRVWRRVLRPNETLNWSAAVSPALMRKNDKSLRSGVLVVAGMLIFVGVLSAKTGYARLVDPGQSNLLGAFSLAFAAACAFGLYHLQESTGVTEETFPFALYGATNMRLIALDKSGKVADEIGKREVEAVTWVNNSSKDELLVVRSNDPEGEKSFYIAHVEGIESLEDLISRNYFEARP